MAGHSKIENLEIEELTDAPDRCTEVFLEGYGDGGWFVALSDR